ncbi:MULTISPECIES: hypothetical protein [Methylobacterium]|uniref:hypothetical protein n=1 Tax=Methylobacterium TaxID=407 RepID=UPI0019D13175|nr:hypothetical protein [Methylobacterium organophilum]
MAKTDKQLTAEQEAIRNAQNDARSLCPRDLQERIALIYGLDVKLEEEKKAVKDVKEEVGAADAMKALTTKRGLPKDAVTFLLKLRKHDSILRARILGTVFGYADDFGWFFRDLFDLDAVGVGSADEAGETAGFDATSEGQRRGGAKAQPRTVEQMAESHTAAETLGIPLAEAERRLEEYRAKNPPKRGAKPKELKALEADVEAARAAHNASESEEGPADLPEAAPGEITEGLREANAASEEHIRQAAAGPSAPPAEEPVAEAVAEKPKRTRKKAEPAAAAPPPPPPAEDDEDDTIPVGPPAHRPDALGSEPSSYRVG